MIGNLCPNNKSHTTLWISFRANCIFWAFISSCGSPLHKKQHMNPYFVWEQKIHWNLIFRVYLVTEDVFAISWHRMWYKSSSFGTHCHSKHCIHFDRQHIEISSELRIGRNAILNSAKHFFRLTFTANKVFTQRIAYQMSLRFQRPNPIQTRVRWKKSQITSNTIFQQMTSECDWYCFYFLLSISFLTEFSIVLHHISSVNLDFV